MPAIVGPDLRERWLAGGKVDPAELFESSAELFYRPADPVA